MAKHEIKYGDTLWAISRKATGRGINYKLIAELNDIEDPNNVPIGTELYVPDKNTNRVSTKDLEEGSGFIEMDEYSPDYDYAVKGNSVYYRTKGADVWSDISDAPGIRDRFKEYIIEEIAQAAPSAQDQPTLGTAGPYANATLSGGKQPTPKPSSVEPSDDDSLFDQIMYYGSLAVNGLRRAFLKRFGDEDRASVLNLPDIPEINPLDVSFTGDTVHVNDRRYFLPESLNISNARFGYRNRGDFSEREGMGVITAFNPFRPKSEINSKKGFYIGVDRNGRFKYGDISKFDNNDMVSRVYMNRVKSFDTNKDGSLRFKEAGKGNRGRYVPIINVIEGGKEVKGSLNFLTGKDNRTDTYGDITGGRVLLITDDGRVRLVSGSIDDVKKEFERVKELSGQDALNVVVLDNGTYSRGLRTYDNRMTEDDLRSYDAQNTSGGNFLFIQDLMETNNIAQLREGGTVSPLIVHTFNPDAFAEAMLNMDRVGNGKGRKVDTKNMEKIYYGLVSRGVNGNQLKALMGTIAEESGGDPYVESSGKNYRGLSQWSKDRLTDEEFKKIKEMSVDDAIDYELDKLIDGLNATSGSDSFTHGGKGSGYDSGAQAMNAFWSPSGTLESVVHALNNGYIRPGDREGTTENRIRAARLLNNNGVLTDLNAPEEFRPIIEDPFFGYYKADGGPTKDEYRDMFRDLYQQDIERIQNGERAVFFGHLNDEPLENVYPEFDLIFNPTKVIGPKGNYGNVVGFSAEDAWKALDKATDIQELIIRVPYNLGRMLNEFVSDVSTKGAKKLISMAPEKYRDTLTKIGRYVKRRPRLTTNFLTSFFYDDITGRNKEGEPSKEQQAQESFNDAFRRAKEAGKERFTWNGREYTTETRPDGGPVNKGMYIAPRDATSIGQLAPNPNARDVTGISQPIDLTEIVAGGIPIVGDVMDARDLYTSIRDRDAIGALFASVGFLPIVGGAAKSALRMRYSPDVLRKRVTYGFDTPEEAARMMGVAEDDLGNTINLLSENIENLPGKVSKETVANIRSQVEKFKKWARESNIPAVRESDKAFNLSRPFDPKNPIEDQKVFDSDYGRIKRFADKYGYDIPDKSDIKSDLELDDVYQRLIRQHRTFVRGVRADSEQEAIEYLFDLAPNTGAGRYGLDPKLDRETKSNYVSNSINQALGYATGYGYNGENGWIGFMRIGKPLDFTKSLDRKDWLDQAEFDYDIRTDDTQWDVTFKKLSNELRKFNPYRVIDFLSRRRKVDENFNMPGTERIDLDFWKLYENSRIPRRFDRYKTQKAESKSILDKYGIELDPDDLPRMSQDYKDYIKRFYNELSERGFKEGDKSPRPMSLDEFNSLYFKLSEREDLARSAILKNPPETGRNFDITHGGGDQGNSLTHYIVTNRGLITPISYQNVGNLNPEDYTRYHEGIASKGLSRREYKYGGEEPDGGPVAQRDAIQPPVNSTMDFMNSIGETVPFYAGELPEIVSSVNLSPEDYRNAMLRAAARRGRNYMYQSQSEAAPLMNGLAASAGLAAFASLGLTSQIPDAALSIFDLLEDPTNPLNYLPFSDLAKVARHRSIKIPEGFGEKSGTEKMVRDNYDYAKEFYLNVLMPIYEDGTNRSIEKLSDSGKRLYDKIKSENGKNVLDVINDVGASWQDEKDVEFILRREAMAKNIKDDLKNKDIPIDVVDDPKHPELPNYDYRTGRISIPSWFNMLGNDEMRRTLIHEMRHMFTESPQQIHRANADVISNFLIGWDEKKKIDNAYKVIGNPETKGSLSRYEKLATNTEIKQILLDDNYFDENMNYRGVGSGSEFGSGHIDPSSNEKINERLDKISDDTLLDILENTNSYGRDYARHIRTESDPSERKIYMDRIRDAVKTIPLFYFPITDPILNEAGPNQDTIIYGNETYGPRISNEKSAKMANEEVMKNGGTVKNYINSLSDNDLLSLYSKTSDYGKKRSYMLYLAKGRDKEVYDILIKDMRESIIKEGEKYDTDRMDDGGYYSDEEENLSPNEAILRRIANDLSSRNMLAENAAYYSGQDEITAEELANYIGKMSPHRFVMSIGSDDDELNDFSTRLTTGVLDGDEQAMEDAETLRRMMLETPFNNSNITIMRDGGNMLPGLEDIYMTPELLKYEQGGEAVKDRQMYVYKRLKEEAHMDDLQALAVIGNLMGESGLNPYLYGDQDTSYGIQQWRGERRDRLNKLAREKGEETPSFETQVDYLINEYLAKPGKNGFIYNDKGKMGSGYYNYSLRDFQNASTLRDATVAWNLGSGRPHKDYMRNDERYRFAKQAANNLGIELDEPDTNYYSDNGIVQNGFSAPSVSLAQNDVPKETEEPESSTVKIEEGNIPDRSTSKPSEGMTEFQQSVINELLIQRGLIMGEQARQQEEAEAQRAAEERQARINEEARRNAIIQSVLQNAKLDIPGMASR